MILHISIFLKIINNIQYLLFYYREYKFKIGNFFSKFGDYILILNIYITTYYTYVYFILYFNTQ